MTTTDLKPGDLVQHPERLLNGLVVHGDGESIRVLHLTSLGIVTTTSDVAGWERVETVRPGHVQVRVDDLDPLTVSSWSQYPGCTSEDAALLRIGRAFLAPRAESTPPADGRPHSRACGIRRHPHGPECHAN